MTEVRFLGICLVLLAVLIEAFGQLCFKKAASGVSSDPFSQDGLHARSWHGFQYITRELRLSLRRCFQERIWIPLGIVFFVIEGLVWTLAIRYLDISVAQPIASIELVLVAVLSALWFRESLTRERIIGILFIISGTALVSFH